MTLPTQGIVTYNRGVGSPLVAGRHVPVRVNLSVGMALRGGLEEERLKVREVLSQRHLPDLMMDLSVAKGEVEPWQILLDEFPGPIGVLPHYLAFDEARGLESAALMSRIEMLVGGGVSFLTIHASVSPELVRLARDARSVPITSRGGGIVIRDMLMKGRRRSVFAELFDDIASLAADAGVVINLGTAFRSASVDAGLDPAAVGELRFQADFAERAKARGAQVVLEGPGHVLLSHIDEYVSLVERLNIPLMPLGPMVTDAHPAVDHVVNAIGAAAMMMRSRGGIINAVTQVEHRGGVPNARVLREALASAQAAAHAATISYHAPSRAIDLAYATARAESESCVLAADPTVEPALAQGDSGCSRCDRLCPLPRHQYREGKHE